jgi:hypothetical protein
MKWILVLVASTYYNSTMLVYPEPFPSVEECKEAGEIWKQQSSFRNSFVCLPSYMRPD